MACSHSPPSAVLVLRSRPTPAAARVLALLAWASWCVACSAAETDDQDGSLRGAQSDNGEQAGAGGAGDSVGNAAGHAGDATNDAGAPTGTVLPPADLDGCYSFVTSRGYSGADTYRVSIYRYAYDPTTRILREDSVEEAASDSPAQRSLYWRVNAEGRLVTYAGDDGQNEEWSRFRHDWYRDEHQNVTSFEFVYEPWDDLTKPTSAEPYMYYAYSQGYDADGRLETSTLVDSDYVNATSMAYTHDENGRCASIETTYPDTPASVETLSYAEGKLAERVVETVFPDEEEPHRIVTTYSYDVQGRPTAVEQDGGGHWQASADGQPDVVEYWTYASDGSWTHESRDYTTDTPNDSIEVDGQVRSCGRAVEAFSPDCAALATDIPRPAAGLECRFDWAGSLPL